MSPPQTVAEQARRLVQAGISVIPIRTDGSKAAVFAWKHFQTRLPTEQELTTWFDGPAEWGLAVVAGRGLEVLDFDEPGLVGQWRARVEAAEPGLVARLPRVETPSGGVHLYLRSRAATGNQKLARTEEGKVRIETRGEGGYVLAPPSPASCHRLGKRYRLATGPDIEEAPDLELGQRDLLFETARSFNLKVTQEVSGPASRDGTRPGDRYEATTTWEEVLEPAGWTKAGQDGGVVRWRKPGSDGPGHHATTGFCGDRLYVFSTSAAPFEAECAYSKFAAFTHLYHGGNFRAAAAALGEEPPTAPVPSADEVVPNEAPDDPHRLARLFLDSYRHADGLTLRHWKGEWLHWGGRCYRPLHEEEVAARLGTFLKEEFDRVNLTEVADYRRRAAANQLRKGEKLPVARPVTISAVRNVLLALKGAALVPSEISPPAWLGEAPFPAGEVLAAANGLVHLPTYLAGEDGFRPPTPLFFSPNALDYSFEQSPPPPTAWLKFLHELWPDDPQSIELLQQWFGYCLLPDTSLQKMLLVVGPRRSGKGTLARVLRGLVGEANYAGPTLSSLAGAFGLAQLLDKTVAVVSDARLSGRTDSGVITERLLSISGEDVLSVERKFREAVNVKLPTRFLILTNELPRMSDASGALAGRMLVLKLSRSWFNEEDAGLTNRLLAELPGVLGWAVEGWRRLRERQHFAQPESGKDMLGQLEDLASPVGAFLRECCEVGPDFQVTKVELFDRWMSWNLAGRRDGGDLARFGRDLIAAEPSVRTAQPRGADGKRVPTYGGVRLRAA